MGKTLKGHDIVVVSQQPWDFNLGSNIKDVVRELCKYNRVLYVNSPLDRITQIRKWFRPSEGKNARASDKIPNEISKIDDNLWQFQPNCIVESINWLGSPTLFNYLNKRNNRMFSRLIKGALFKLGFNNFILVNDSEIFKAFYLIDYLNPHLSIYYSRDNMLAVPYWKKHGSRLEPKLIQKNDICFTNSDFLAEYCKTYNNDTYNVGQGCNIDFILASPMKRPNDLQDVNRKIIGYVGALSSMRLDIQLITRISGEFPDVCIVLVGPEDDVFRASKLHQCGNILFLGRKDVEVLPAYINAFDVCINPQLVNDVTIGNYPRKIDEYLALGKPVVATKTITMQAFNQVVYLADSHDGFVSAIKSAFKSTDTEIITRRQNLALSHSWENCVLQMGEKINNKLKL